MLNEKLKEFTSDELRNELKERAKLNRQNLKTVKCINCKYYSEKNYKHCVKTGRHFFYVPGHNRKCEKYKEKIQ